MPRVVVTTICKPTENPDKVMRSMLNIFPDLQIEEVDEELVGTSESVANLEELLRKQRIRSAARAVFRKCVEGDRLRFRLNKQVAFVGKVNFAESSPLGDIEVTIEDDDIEGLIDRIAPRTPEG
ncbi:MAG: RNA-binding domain-containing protein [Thermoplasmata archaeon]